MKLEQNFSKRFLNECRRAREAAGLSQKEMAARFGYSRANISEFENGRNKNGVLALEYVRLGAKIEQEGDDNEKN